MQADERTHCSLADWVFMLVLPTLLCCTSADWPYSLRSLKILIKELLNFYFLLPALGGQKEAGYS